jgi:hypothetical protein
MRSDVATTEADASRRPLSLSMNSFSISSSLSNLLAQLLHAGMYSVVRCVLR